MAFCTACETEKDISEFYLRCRPRKSDGEHTPFSECKQCSKLRQRRNRSRPEFLAKEAAHRRRRREEQPEKERILQRRRGLRHRFGIDLPDFEAMNAAQEGLCAICGNPETAILHGRTLPLSIDHCHITGAIRGLLCKRCNTGLGNFNDNFVLLRAAMSYLSRYEAEPLSA